MKSLLQSIMCCLVFLCINISGASSSSAALAASPARTATASGAIPPLVLSKEDAAKKDSSPGKGSPNKEDLTPRSKLYKKTKERFDKAWDDGDAQETEKLLRVLEQMYKTDHLDHSKFIHYEKMLNVIDLGTFLEEKRALLDEYEQEAKKQHGQVAAFRDYFRINFSLLNQSFKAFKKIASPLNGSYNLIEVAHEAFKIQEQWSILKSFVDSYELSNFILHEMGNNEKDSTKKIVWHLFKADMDKEVARVAKDYQQLLQKYKALYARFTKVIDAKNKKEAEEVKKLIDDQFIITGFEKYKIEHIPDVVEILKINYEINSLINALPERLSKESDDRSVSNLLIEWDKEFNSRVEQCDRSFSAVKDVDSLIDVMKKYMNVLLWFEQIKPFIQKSDKKPSTVKEFQSHIEKRMKGLAHLELKMKNLVKITPAQDLSILLNTVNLLQGKAEKEIKNIDVNDHKYFDAVLKLLQDALPQYLLLFTAESIETEIAQINHSSEEVAAEKHDFEKSVLLSDLPAFKNIVTRLIKALNSEQVKKHFFPEDIKRWLNKAEAFLTWVDNEDSKKAWQDPF